MTGEPYIIEISFGSRDDAEEFFEAAKEPLYQSGEKGTLSLRTIDATAGREAKVRGLERAEIISWLRERADEIRYSQYDQDRREKAGVYDEIADKLALRVYQK